jgi:hypothetical protein
MRGAGCCWVWDVFKELFGVIYWRYLDYARYDRLLQEMSLFSTDARTDVDLGVVELCSFEISVVSN